MNRDRIVEKFLDYVKIYSPSQEEAEFAKVLKSELKDLGFSVDEDDAGEKSGSNSGNIIAHLKGEKDVESIMLCAHMDTVVPCKDIEPIIEDGIIKSKGDTILSADDKAGIVAILEAIRYIKENEISHGDIEVVFTISEEIGLLGSKYLDYSKIKSKNAFILDSGGPIGGVIVQGPSAAGIKAIFHGKASHAGLSPEKGINAIQMAARAIDKMNLLRIDEETTANVGLIKGGLATNIVADYAEAHFEARSLDSEKLKKQVKHMVDTLSMVEKDFGSKIEIEVENSYPAFSVDGDNEILKITKKAMKKANVEYKPESTGGGSDTNIFNGNGLNAVTLAVGMYNAHGVDEYISVDDLIKATELVVAIIESI